MRAPKSVIVGFVIAILLTAPLAIRPSAAVNDIPVRVGQVLTSFKALRGNRDLILYSYHETPEAFRNFDFFLRHALHAKADFIIMLNGAHTLNLEHLRLLRNVRIVERANRCFDLGGFHEILTDDPALIKRYRRFMFLNASLRGPFFPPWADRVCWSDAWWDKLDARVKVAGLTFNCANNIPYPPHLQSMILAFDQRTLEDILLPNMQCYEDMTSAVRDGETAITGWITEAGGDVFAMESRFAAHAGPSRKNTTAFLEWCVDTAESLKTGPTHWNDVLHTGLYEGSTLHPYETM